ncbi:MAG: hypothetical protein M1839_004349, partial [Geoglossum umbratile]
MRMASDKLVLIKEYAQFQVNVAGVGTWITAYVTGTGTKAEDVIMLLGRILTHNSVEIQGRARSIVDAFVHQAPLRWKDKQLKALTRYKRKGGLGTAKKEKKGKGKQLAMDEDLDDAENAENVEGLQDTDTDEELK